MNVSASPDAALLLDDGPSPSLRDLAAAFRRRLRWFILVAVVVSVVIGITALLLPPVYRSQSLILIERQEVPSAMVRSTVTSFVEARIEEYKQRIITRDNLVELMRRFELYPDLRATEPLEAMLERMREAIGVDMVSVETMDPESGRPMVANIAFRLSFEYSSARKAQAVANELTTLFLEENIKTRTRKARETSSFLAGEVESLAKTIEEREAELATFKAENVGRLPELEGLNFQLLNTTTEKLRATQAELTRLREQQITLSARLAATPKDLSVAPGNETTLSPSQRLALLESRLLGLKGRYAAGHPDIVRTSRELDALRAELGVDGMSAEARDKALAAARAELAEARQRYAPEHPEVSRLERQVAELEATPVSEDAEVAPTNPAYLQLATQLEAVQLNIASLRNAVAEQTAERQRYEDRLAATPGVEQEFRTLLRDYDNAVAKYREVKNKQLEAELAEALETERKGERFTLIEPPIAPTEPVRPNRRLIGLLGIVAGLTVGLGVVALVEALDQRVYGARGVELLTGRRPLAMIPAIETSRDRRRRALRRSLALVLVLAAGLGAVAFVHFTVMPLDVLVLRLTRQLGL